MSRRRAGRQQRSRGCIRSGAHQRPPGPTALVALVAGQALDLALIDIELTSLVTQWLGDTLSSAASRGTDFPLLRSSLTRLATNLSWMRRWRNTDSHRQARRPSDHYSTKPRKLQHSPRVRLFMCGSLTDHDFCGPAGVVSSHVRHDESLVADEISRRWGNSPLLGCEGADGKGRVNSSPRRADARAELQRERPVGGWESAPSRRAQRPGSAVWILQHAIRPDGVVGLPG
jgi:hypothetical protein